MFRKQARRAQGGQARSFPRRVGAKSRVSRGTTQGSRFGRGKFGYLKPRFNFGRGLPAIASDRYRTKHKYSFAVAISVTAGVSSPYVLRGNSVFDPDFTSTGYSAMGYGTLATLYNRYQVTGSSIRVRCVSTNAAQVSVMPSISSGTISTAAEDYAENPYGKDVMLQTASGVQIINSYMSTSKMYGELTDADFAGAAGANPANPWYWHIKAGPVISAAATVDVYVLVDLVYYTEWSRRFSLSTR